MWSLTQTLSSVPNLRVVIFFEKKMFKLNMADHEVVNSMILIKKHKTCFLWQLRVDLGS